jgi:diaminopimelate decarboxylase
LNDGGITLPNFAVPDAVFEAAAKHFPTPFYLYDEAGIRQTARTVNQAFAWAPAFKEYFAVKALPNPAILRILMEEGCGLDCSSETELLLAKRIGAEGKDIMFSANAMPPHEFALAREMGATINLDDPNDIDTLVQNGGIPEVISLRINPGPTLHGGKGNVFMGSPQESKFGWMPRDIEAGLKKLKTLGVRQFGLHAMLASNSINPGYYPAQADYLFNLGLDMQEKTGLPLAFINLSGGIGIPYRPEEATVDILSVGEQVKAVYQRCFGKNGQVAIKTEMGRFMTGPHGFLVARATHRKDGHKTFIGLDACAANLMRPAIYGAYHHISVVGKGHLSPTHTYDITGALCENNDKFAIDRHLPPIEIGDLVVIHDAGAHGWAMGYQYNGRLRSAEVLHQADGAFRLIRRAETPGDYFATLVMD